ncbi:MULTISPECIES: fluoride efflux transporter CrcB [Limosilactobacillus]|uniref:Fluoride-specific ion channel FluC n=2 Tax=Limosilactobacillus TaxID=2742598 RepID=A0A839GZI7_9LACO|nr:MULTISPECIES: fluoride efflux transporter CrcB [Limosilactobacillus]MBB1123613.1 fluoride efflux transporter CrcB [Limosilactobacillus albertensis]MCD7123103.1 fluoride efflux transporter CrcB [Limosilactobacillus albertensis]GGI63384.1 camphor resistance protein CrcB [Limosilactobacillus caviae]
MNIIITDLLAAGVGAFFGGGLRSLLSDVLNTDYDHYRWGTIMANLIGSLLIGVFAGMVTSDELRNTMNVLLATGFCGGLTTFSTFSLETLKYFKSGKKLLAWTYWVGSVIACICCVYLGLWFHSWL